MYQTVAPSKRPMKVKGNRSMKGHSLDEASGRKGRRRGGNVTSNDVSGECNVLGNGCEV
jgi:hypothetical protein